MYLHIAKLTVVISKVIAERTRSLILLDRALSRNTNYFRMTQLLHVAMQRYYIKRKHGCIVYSTHKALLEHAINSVQPRAKFHVQRHFALKSSSHVIQGHRAAIRAKQDPEVVGMSKVVCSFVVILFFVSCNWQDKLILML